jgi:hypothetical protein
MKLKKGFKILTLTLIGVGALGLLLGCGSVLQEQKKESTPTVSPPTAPRISKKVDRPEGRYYDFDDVLIPNELKLDSKSSKIFQSPTVTAGVLVFDGYVEVKSLVDFFKDAMNLDNWRLRGNFKLPPKTILFFEKKNKRCLLFVEENMLNTRVEIWMIPTQDGQ